jgi:hypothetical protein
MFIDMFVPTSLSSIKLHTPETKKRSIAHFYRPCTIYPYVPPLDIFGSTDHPTEVRTEQGLGWSLSGEKGKVRVIAELPRPDWVAGQNVWIKIFADNQSQKKVSCKDIVKERPGPDAFHPYRYVLSISHF